MGQSFYTSIGGIKAAQSQINVVADNLSNINTLAFKEANITFSDVYYNTLSSGSGPTRDLGGTNPRQIGIGTQVASIDRKFTTGSNVTTGKDTDFMIQGNGFFTVMNQNNEVLYTRAGNFTMDGEGNLSLPNGYRLMGATSSFGTQSGSTPIKIPPVIQTETVPNTVDIGTKALKNLNNVNITNGDFKITITDTSVTPNTSSDVTVTIADGDTLSSIAGKINTALGANGSSALVNGKLAVTAAADRTFTFTSGDSNFVTATELNTATPTAGVYSSKVLDFKQNVAVADNPETSVKYAGMNVYQDGSIEVKYSNGDKLTVTQDDNKQTVFKYTTSEGVVIKGADVSMPTQVAIPANFQLQVANFINPNGLNAQGGNCYAKGPNCGDAFYGTPNTNGFGALQSGTLEGSNVDMTKQFADMIVAQRAIEANSRVFDTQNQVMKSLAYLGS